MKLSAKFLIVFFTLICWHRSHSQTVDEFIQKAEALQQSGDLTKAASLMEEAIKVYPNNSTAYSYLGFYRGMLAGKTQNFMEAGQLVNDAFDKMEKAVNLDSENPVARFHRGILGVKVPSFLNKLDQGIQDLEYLVKIHEMKPDNFTRQVITHVYDFLAEGLSKQGKNQRALSAWQKVIELAPGTELAESAQRNIAKLSVPKETTVEKTVPEPSKYTSSDAAELERQIKAGADDAANYLKLGKAYLDTKNFEQAEKVLKIAIEKDSSNIEAYKLLIASLGEIAGKGYDKRIYDDTNWRSNLAFEVVKYADKAVAISPSDLQLRLIRGTIGVMMPFFVGKLDQAIEDLNLVKDGQAADEQKAEAMYWLGMAFQKRATTFWIDVVTKYEKTEASKLAFQSFRPMIKRIDFSKWTKPFLLIDFVIGFRDELPPQTAIWIEDKNGKFIKTIYMSGFSGFAKEKQVNLGDWAKASKFEDADVVTGASIDVGHHVYSWDLTDHHNKKVASGDYLVKAEIAFWPSMQYQAISAQVSLGQRDSRCLVEEGNLVPYFEAKYVAQ